MIGSLLIGVVLVGVVVWLSMPKLMFRTCRSRFGFEETIKSLEQSIVNHGWAHKSTWMIHEDLRKKGVAADFRIANLALCKALYASEILSVQSNRFIACLMPCAFSVWEARDGQVYVSKMNTTLMGKMFGGVIAKVMGQHVGKEEDAILSVVMA